MSQESFVYHECRSASDLVNAIISAISKTGLQSSHTFGSPFSQTPPYQSIHRRPIVINILNPCREGISGEAKNETGVKTRDCFSLQELNDAVNSAFSVVSQQGQPADYYHPVHGINPPPRVFYDFPLIINIEAERVLEALQSDQAGGL